MTASTRERDKNVRRDKQPLTIVQILSWADDHHRRTQRWPRCKDGDVADAPGEKWSNIDNALRLGTRSLKAGSSLAKLLQHHRGVRNNSNLPNLSEELILQWADELYDRTGSHPACTAGAIPGVPGENWHNIDAILRQGGRGLRGGSSLPQLLKERRGVPNSRASECLTAAQILAWADEYHLCTGDWPSADFDCIPGGTIKWSTINADLCYGRRGLARGSSLARLLAEHRGVTTARSRLSIAQILKWADAYHQRSGNWPSNKSEEPIADAPTEKWASINNALRFGYRSLPKGLSVSRLLQQYRGVRNVGNLPQLTERLILLWADLHEQRTGEWPHAASGPIPESPGETWQKVNAALTNGHRNLPGGSSLAQLLAGRRQARIRRQPPSLSERQILSWADAFRRRTRRWPTSQSGAIPESPGETWKAVAHALARGGRSLPGGDTLSRLLQRERHVPNRSKPPQLTVRQILIWADAHIRMTGKWPTSSSGPILASGGVTWAAVDRALKYGSRGLPGGSSLFQLLVGTHRRPPNQSPG